LFTSCKNGPQKDKKITISSFWIPAAQENLYERSAISEGNQETVNEEQA
jgi:hypothetical protein